MSGAPLPAVPLYFGPADRRLFGLYHAPSGTVRREAGLVICNPLGYASVCSHRPLRHLAQRASKAGFPVLRFDYDGTGDSAGSDGDPGRVQAWLRSVQLACQTLLDQAGVNRVNLFGLRLGGTLATVAAAALGEVDGLVLWSPVLSGRAYVREVRAFRLLQGHPPPPPEVTIEEGQEEAAGYFLGPATVADLRELDLLTLPQRPARRVLIIERDDLPPEPRLVAHLTTLGCDPVHAVRLPGYAEALADPHNVVVPHAVIDETINWLADTADVSPLPAPRPALPVASQVSATMELTSQSSAYRSAMPLAAPAIRETPVFFGATGGLFGILSEPIDPTGGRRRRGIVLSNAGAVHHVGQNRMYVTLARLWAAQGLTVLRFDLSGVGESHAPPGRPEHALFEEGQLDDLDAALAFLRTLKTERLVLAGLCAGAYISYHTALRGADVEAIILMNPPKLRWRKGETIDEAMREIHVRTQTRYYRSTFLQKEVWLKAMRGQVNFRHFGQMVFKRAKTVVAARGSFLVRRLGLHPSERDLGAEFRELCNRGVNLFFLFSADDPGIDWLRLYAGRALDRIRSHPRFRFEVVPGTDHTFTPVWSQARVVETLSRMVASLGR